MYHAVLNESQNCEILVIMIDIIIWSDVRIISEKNLGWSASALWSSGCIIEILHGRFSETNHPCKMPFSWECATSEECGLDQSSFVCTQYYLDLINKSSNWVGNGRVHAIYLEPWLCYCFKELYKCLLFPRIKCTTHIMINNLLYM